MSTKSEATISDILAAAEALFIEKNYADVSMTEIAEHTRVTKGGLYHHFPSKEALYMEMIFGVLAEVSELCQQAVDSEGTCYDRLRLANENIFKMPQAKRRVLRLVRRDINTFEGPARRQLILAYQRALPEKIESILEDGIKAGEIRAEDPRLLSWELVSMIEIVLTGYARRSIGSADKRLNFVLRLFFDGVGQGQP
ncbi:MAG: TetR/AcrR family transcriptional regulator [Anaerolineales bacterium]|nr:TetR/AcrR family transcriptional regulator [Anaerolineales bacterium]